LNKSYEPRNMMTTFMCDSCGREKPASEEARVALPFHIGILVLAVATFSVWWPTHTCRDCCEFKLQSIGAIGLLVLVVLLIIGVVFITKRILS